MLKLERARLQGEHRYKSQVRGLVGPDFYEKYSSEAIELEMEHRRELERVGK